MGAVIGYGLLLVIGIAAGLATYETLMHVVAPKSNVVVAEREVGDKSHTDGSSKRGVLKRSGYRIFATSLPQALDRFAPLARSETDACRDRLGRAGMSIAPGTWRSVRVLSTVLGGLVAGVLLIGFASAPFGVRLVVLGLGVFGGWTLPALYLSSRTRSRTAALEASLPDAMELLGIAIAAGSPVEQCFREVAASLEGPLAEEFSLVDQEVNLLGHARETALENLGKRCGSTEVTAFVAQLTQAVSQGTSIAESLANQAKLSRDTAQAEALERIRKMPTKLDVVLSLCFLPPTVALVVVPTVVTLLQFLNDTMG